MKINVYFFIYKVRMESSRFSVNSLIHIIDIITLHNKMAVTLSCSRMVTVDIYVG